MRMSDQEYFRSCVAQERHLAQLLGHEVEEYYESAGVLWENTRPMPQWTRDWSACGPLLTAYDIPLAFDHEPEDGHGSAVVAGPIVVRLSDHPSKDRAVMFAIVKAVIHCIEHHKNKASHPAHSHPPHHSHHVGQPAPR